MTTGRGCGVCWVLLALLGALVVGIGYRLISGAPTQTASDGRAEIALAAADRDVVLAEMRAFLGAVQGIAEALTREDMTVVATQARAMGLSAMGQVPPSLLQALPLEFKTLGRSVHAEFDQLALDAEEVGDAAHGLRQLSAILTKCVACHAAYRLTVAKEGR